MPEQNKAEKEPITIKKYANRRLYNKATSTYVTLDHLSQMVKDDVDFVVYDAKSGEDITRSVLTQIIVEEESKGQHLLPTSFLRHLISFYGDSLQSMVPRYLEHSMQSFAHNQGHIRQYMQDAMNGLFPFNQFEELGKQNMSILENAMKLMTPYQVLGTGNDDNAAKTSGEATEKTQSQPVAPSVKETDDEEQNRLNELRSKLAEMQQQLETLSALTKKD